LALKELRTKHYSDTWKFAYKLVNSLKKMSKQSQISANFSLCSSIVTYSFIIVIVIVNSPLSRLGS